MAPHDSHVDVKVETTASADLYSYGNEASEIGDRITAALMQNPVVVFGKTWCPFCIEVRSTFADLGVPVAVFNVDTMAKGGDVHDTLKKLHKQSTVPYVFINQEFVGGCDATKELQRSGKLYTLLKKAGVPLAIHPYPGGAHCAVLEGKSYPTSTLFHFPETVDDRVVRLVGVQVFIICLLVAIFYKHTASWWVMVGVMTDYALRLGGGGNFSALGSSANLAVALAEVFGSKPWLVPGPPKQFASLCGLMFSGCAVVFYLCSTYEWKLVHVGLAFTCALGAAAALEGFIGFCLGCFMFSLAVQFKLVPADVYTVHSNSRAEVEYTWNEMNKRLNEGVPASHVKHYNDDYPCSIDYKYKAKTDDQTREDFNILKHVKITHFIMHLSLAGCAVCWKFADPKDVLDGPAVVWYIFALGSAGWFALWLALYAMKMVLYPRKVHKEWMCNVQGNSFVLPFVITVLYAYLVKDQSQPFSIVLFWIGAPAGLALSFIRVGDWIAERKDIEHINAGWMLMPVSNFIAALIGPTIDADYRDAMQFWFAFALMMWCLLFVVSFFKAIVYTENDDRRRPMLAIWVAAPAIAAVAYNSCFVPFLVYPTSDYNDFIFLNLYWMSLGMAFVLLWCFFRPFFGRIKFDMGYWAGGFPADALCIAALQYHAIKQGALSGGIAYAALAVATGLNAVLAMQTLAAMLQRRVFVPDYKWGPLSFMKLTHEAFKEAIPRLQEMVKMMEVDNSGKMVPDIKEAWAMIKLVHDEHAKHEDDVIFKHYNDLFPGVAGHFNKDHEEGHSTIHAVDTAVERLSEAAAASKDIPSGVVSDAAAQINKYCEDMLVHLRGEEDHLQGLPRKHVPLATAKEIIKKVWDVTPSEKWFKILPWTVNNLPMLQQRVRFVRTFLWAMPDRAQQMGAMVALGVDPVTWKRLVAEEPAIIPRGACGWTKYF